METAGYLASAMIGVCLGLMGGGGSILTLPILVYLFSISPTSAISYSLFIVGCTSLFGTIDNYRRGFVNLKTAFLFGSPSLATVLITRNFVTPFLPDVFFKLHRFTITRPMFEMIVFAMLLITASISMINNNAVSSETRSNQNPSIIFIVGLVLGMVTGFLGAGGGFLLIPALVLLGKLQMKEAIGTSLLIIALNSLIGFASDIGRHPIDWKFLIIVTSISISGTFIGGFLNQKINSENLRKGFGWFSLTIALYMLTHEILMMR